MSRFNGSTTKPLGYIKFMVTYGDADVNKPLFRTVKTLYLVLPCKSAYQCIIGGPTLGRLGAVASTIPFKMKFYSTTDKVVTLQANLESSRKCHYMMVKTEHESEATRDIVRTSSRGSEVNVVDLNARYDLNSTKEEDGNDTLAKELKKRIKRTELDGEFISVQVPR